MVQAKSPATSTESADKSGTRTPGDIGFALLAVGVALLALVLGFMIAASGTPVGSIAIPAAFGIAVSALGLIYPQLRDSKAEGSKAASDQQRSHSDSRGHGHAQAQLGIALISFSVAFAIGIYLGASARLSGWLSPAPPALDPTWHRRGLPPPPSAEAAVYWLSVQNVLQERGLKEEHIASIYELQAKDWTARISSGASMPSAPTPSASAVPPGSKPTTLDDLFRGIAPPGNPIAHEPMPFKKGEDLRGLPS